jgi:multiple sugar transport system substrate-binding protein
MDSRNTFQRIPHLNRRQFLKAATAAGTLVGASALLDACGATPVGGPSGPSNITIMYNQGELIPPGYKGSDPVYINSFNKLHKGSITSKYLEYDKTRLTSMMAAGTPPDMIRTPGGPEMATLMAKGVAANLQTYFSKSTVIKEDDLESVNDYYRWDGHQQSQGARYGMVKDWSQDAMIWYNTELFKKAGIAPLDPKVPITYDKLLELGKQLTVTKNGKIQIYGLNGAWVWWPGVIAMQNLAQNGQELYADGGTKALIKDNEVVYQTFKWIVDWAQAKVGPGPLTPETTWDGTLWLAGREAMSVWGYWYGGGLYTDGNLPANAGFAPAPQMGPTIVNANFGGTGAYIPTKSRNKDAAFTFMEYYLGGGGPKDDDPATTRAKSGFGLPGLKHLRPLLPQRTDSEKAAYEVQMAALQYAKPLVFSPYDTGFGAAWEQYMPDVYKNKVDLKTAIASIDAATNKAIQQNVTA